MKRVSIFVLLLGLLAAQFNTLAVAANPQAGMACSKLGKIQIFQNKKYTCIKSGKKYVWNKGVKTPSPVTTISPDAPTKPVAAASDPVKPEVPKIAVSGDTEYRSINECKLINRSINNDVNVSHSNRNWKLFDPSKPMRVLIFSVDFPDLVSPTLDSPNFSDLQNAMQSFYKSQSNNRLSFNWTIAPKFTRMSNSIASYGVGSRAAGSVWKLNNDIQDLAFKTYNKNDFDFIIGSAPTTTTREQIASSPAFGSGDANYLGATYLGGDYWSNGSSWTVPAHEFGHFALGIADLYDFKSSMLGQSGFEQQFQYLGVYDIMNWAGGAGLELTAWSRWIAKLISDSQMLCLPNTPTTTLLRPIEDVSDAVKGLVIPVTDSQAIVIENRAAKGFDSRLDLGGQGIIAYLVDTSIETGYGPIRIIRKNGSSNVWFQDNALKAGESLNYLGYSVKIVGASGDQYFVEVQKVG